MLQRQFYSTERIVPVNNHEPTDSAVSEPSTITAVKEEMTPLVKHLHDMIKFSGPLSVAQYMRQALTNPLGGYYMQQQVFGARGDFVTSPEISQMFGELVGVWFMTNWMKLGTPNSVQLVELGPGRGTLMADMLRALRSFAAFQGVKYRVVFVEASPRLRNEQMATIVRDTGRTVAKEHRNQFDTLEHVTFTDGLEVYWVENIVDIEHDDHTMLVAHEFFDALPVYKFKHVDGEWREIMVDVDESAETAHHFRYVLAPQKTNAVGTLIDATGRYNNLADGTTVEVSPESTGYMQRIGDLLTKTGGTALVVDYGNDHPASASLRAIRDHQFTDLFSTPGQADLSVDVDFSLLKWALEKHDGVRAYGPTTQRHFLASLGIYDRMQALVQAAGADATAQRVVKSAFNRLVSAREMGTVYKCLAVTDARYDGVPVGFERADFPSAPAPATMQR
ncbi:NADH dehydrogenase [ubiquinone] complex I, assembly factor 7 [Allomyces arbusculus]|nr:NADH dehydrogenase [ubiquinone] complex I, assembly factor 7 [Allomyces arbusculus]